MSNPIDGFTVTLADISYVGQDLQRPECILAEPDGTVHGLNGSGRAPAGAEAAWYRENGHARMPQTGAHAVTVPGARAGITPARLRGLWTAQDAPPADADRLEGALA